jgi:hypothetical protein
LLVKGITERKEPTPWITYSFSNSKFSFRKIWYEIKQVVYTEAISNRMEYPETLHG